jgi:hypothetical protein
MSIFDSLADAPNKEPPAKDTKVWQVSLFSGGRLVHLGRFEREHNRTSILQNGPVRPAFTNATTKALSIDYREINTGEWVTVTGTFVVETVDRDSPRPSVFGATGPQE